MTSKSEHEQDAPATEYNPGMSKNKKILMVAASGIIAFYFAYSYAGSFSGPSGGLAYGGGASSGGSSGAYASGATSDATSGGGGRSEEAQKHADQRV
ncbi:MAG: hypothetical protein M1548_08885 [Actinobacteria bacterium]|nr:hypothetical protein [Actinomycetota bacterium]